MIVTKDYLMQATAIAKAETATALQLVYGSLNQGQQKKLLKDDAVKALFERYGVVT